MISNSTIDENTDTTSGNVAIGDLSASEAVAFALVAGTGDTDNARFTIDEGELQILQDQVVDHEVQDSYSVLVQATDAAGNSSTEVLTITVNDLAEQVVLDASVFAAAGGLVTIRLAGDQIEFVDDEGDSVSPSHDADKVTSISATGRSGADDTLVVDVNGLGDLPVSFEGGTGGNDGLEIIDSGESTFSTVTHQFDTPNDGMVTISSGPAITYTCLLYTSPSPRDQRGSRMPSSA